MTDQQFSILWGEALTSPDRDEFVSEFAISSLWGDADGAPITAERLRDLGKLWDAAHMTVKDIRQHLGLNQQEFAARFLLSHRTVQNWEYGATKCPEYVRLLLLQATGLYNR